jgi:hypothetical protein
MFFGLPGDRAETQLAANNGGGGAQVPLHTH